MGCKWQNIYVVFYLYLNISVFSDLLPASSPSRGQLPMYWFRVVQNTQITASPSPQFYRGIYHSRHSGRENTYNLRWFKMYFICLNVVQSVACLHLCLWFYFKYPILFYDPIKFINLEWVAGSSSFLIFFTKLYIEICVVSWILSVSA